MADHSDTILSTVETFLDTAPDLEEASISFTEQTGGGLNPRKLTIFIDGVQYNVTAKRVEG